MGSTAYDELSADSLDRLDDICQRFEDDARAGGNPRVEGYIANVIGDDTGTLLDELISLELEYRMRRQDPSVVVDLEARFPTTVDFIRALSARASVLSFSSIGTPPGLADTGKEIADSLFANLPSVPGYENFSLIGRGGMGLVFKARHRHLGRDVAVKMLRFPNDSVKARRRFDAEAEVVARLQHPHIVQIFEVGEHDGRPFFAMEYVTGGSLRDLIKSRGLSAREAAALISTLAIAIHYAHEQGVIHRDLKPENVLLRAAETSKWPIPVDSELTDGSDALGRLSARVKITDFGLAKLRESELAQTETGEVLGTAHYMAPEQARGATREIGPTTDIYALGSILYELLTCETPFRGATSIEVFRKLDSDDPVPPRHRRALIPRDLDSICMKCLEKHPLSRYSSGIELAEDLARFLRGEPVKARPLGNLGRFWRSCRRHRLIASLSATMLFGLIVGLPALAFLYASSRRHENAAVLAERRSSELRRRSDLEVARSWSSTAAKLLEEGDLTAALVWDLSAWRREKELLGDRTPEYEQREAAHRLLAAATFEQVPRLVESWSTPARPIGASFDDNGKRALVKQVNKSASIRDLSTHETIPSWTSADPASQLLEQSGDGRWSLTIAPDQTLEQRESRTGKLVGSLRLPKSMATFPYLTARLSPDGTIALFEIVDVGTVIMVADVAQSRWITPVAVPASSSRDSSAHPDYFRAEFTSDGAHFLTWNLDGEALVWDSTTARPVIPKLRHGAGVSTAALSADGRVLVTGTVAGSVHIWEMDSGRAISTRTEHTAKVTEIVFDPAGDRFVTTSEDGSARIWDLASGSSLSEPARHRSPIRAVAFSPDGLCFMTGSDDGTARIWESRSGRPISAALVHLSPVTAVAFSPDGGQVLTASADRQARLWDLRALRSSHRLLIGHAGPVNRVRFSTDGGRLASACDDGSARIWNVRTGRLERKLSEMGAIESVAWSRSSEWITTTSARGFRVWESQTGRPTTALIGTHLGNNTGVDDVWFMEGDRIAIAFADHVNFLDLAAFGDTDQIRMLNLSKIAYSADRSRFAVYNRSELQVYQHAPLARLAQWPLDRVEDLQFDPGGNQLAVAGENGVFLIDIGAMPSALSPKVLSDHHSHLVRCGNAGQVMSIRDAGRMEIHGSGMGPGSKATVSLGGVVVFANFDPSGKRIVTVYGNGQARLWDSRTGYPLAPPLEHGGPARHADLSPDGKILAIAGTDGAISLWTLPEPDDRDFDELLKTAERMASRRHDPSEPTLVQYRDVSVEPPMARQPTQSDVVSWHCQLALEGWRVSRWSSVIFHLSRVLNGQPDDDFETLRQLAEALERAGQHKSCISRLDVMIDRAPEDGPLRLWRARLLFEDGRYVDALEDLTAAARSADAPISAAASAWRCLALRGQGRDREAREAYRQAAERCFTPVEESVVFEKSSDPAVASRRRDAFQPLLKRLQGTPRNETPGLKSLPGFTGLVYAALGDWSRADAEFRLAIQTAPIDPVVRRGLLLVQLERRSFQEAARLANEAVLVAPDDAKLRLLRACAKLRLDDHQLAYEDAKRAIELGADGPATRWVMGLAAMALDRHTEALDHFEQQIRMEDGSNPASLKRAAMILARDKQWERAADRLGAVLRTSPMDREALLPYVITRKLAGHGEDPAVAVRPLFSSPRCVRDSSEIDRRLWIASFVDRPPPEMKVWVEQLTAMLPTAQHDEATYLTTLAAIKHRAGEDREAETLLLRSIQLGGGGARVWFLMARVEYRLGDLANARDYFEKALAASAAVLEKPAPVGNSSSAPAWTSWLELELLRQEAASLLKH